MIFKPNSNLMKGLNLALSVKGLLKAGLFVMLGLLSSQLTAQTLNNSSDELLSAGVSKNASLLVQNANWVSESEAIQLLVNARNQMESQLGNVTTDAEKMGLAVRSEYYWVLANTIKKGSTVSAALVNTWDSLLALCARSDNLVAPETVLSDVVDLLSN
ncbi:MAG: hypothetical protein D6706_20515 [Chloroflexi bacterium]|nr:MAG: hypothetical protein D6706_20515 [Chloroflexota bacterium]